MKVDKKGYKLNMNIFKGENLPKLFPNAFFQNIKFPEPIQSNKFYEFISAELCPQPTYYFREVENIIEIDDVDIKLDKIESNPIPVDTESNLIPTEELSEKGVSSWLKN